MKNLKTTLLLTAAVVLTTQLNLTDLEHYTVYKQVKVDDSLFEDLADDKDLLSKAKLQHEYICYTRKMKADKKEYLSLPEFKLLTEKVIEVDKCDNKAIINQIDKQLKERALKSKQKISF